MLKVEELIMFIERCNSMNIIEKKEIYKRIFIFGEIFSRSVDKGREVFQELEEIGFIVNDEWLILKTIVLGMAGNYEFNQTIQDNWNTFEEGIRYVMNGGIYEAVLNREDIDKAETYAFKRVGEDLDQLLVE